MATQQQQPQQELPLKGSCLCGTVQYEVSTPLTEIGCCYCSQCRRSNGTAFGTNSPIPESSFTITKGLVFITTFYFYCLFLLFNFFYGRNKLNEWYKIGEEKITKYESTPGKVRCFCSVCGSPTYSKKSSLPGVVRIRVGSITTPLVGVGVQYHFYTASAASWVSLPDDGLPRYPAAVPPRVVSSPLPQ